MAPEYEISASAFKFEKDVIVAKMDSDKHKTTPGKYGVTGFPTLKFFPKGSSDKEAEAYTGARDAKGIVDFLNERAGTHRTVDGTLDDMAGRTTALDKLANKFYNAEDKQALIAEAEGAEK